MNASPLLMGLFNAALTLAAVMVAITFSLPHGWSGWQRLQQSGRETQAAVVSCDGGGKHRSMSFTYTVDARSYQGSGSGCLAAGSEVAIVYLPDDPSISATKRSQNLVKWLFAMGFGVAALSGFTGSWAARKRLAMRQR
ncbi:MAG TPA: DUF3592 domain-containing protein [Xanthomonadaceae bacterium]|jgi:hypothetical protein|nr:DUF3592 domain-containing protein [Xanthomonadaceae bacterium]